MVSISDLTLTDVEFLQTIKEINKYPEKHKHTDKGEMPANSKSIRLSSSLNANQVSYRMGGNTNSRGFAESNNPLIISYQPVKINSGFSPRSVKLTEKGKEILEKSQEQINEISGISRAEFEEMKEKIGKIEELEEKISRIEPIARKNNDGQIAKKFLKTLTGKNPGVNVEDALGRRELRAEVYFTLYDAADNYEG